MTASCSPRTPVSSATRISANCVASTWPRRMRRWTRSSGRWASTRSGSQRRSCTMPGAGRSSIKGALIDQTRIAGIGNFLSDEILWRAGIDPRTPTSGLTGEQWARLHRSLQKVVRAAARAGHTPRGPRWLTGARWGTRRPARRAGSSWSMAWLRRARRCGARSVNTLVDDLGRTRGRGARPECQSRPGGVAVRFRGTQRALRGRCCPGRACSIPSS